MRIGYRNDDYPNLRNVVGLVSDSTYRKVHDVNKFRLMLSSITKRLSGRRARTPYDLRFSFNDLDLNRVDIFHLFNSISFGKRPWVTTFETVVPRISETISCHWGRDCGYETLIGNGKVHRFLDALSGPACRKLIAMSECNLNMQKDLLKNFPGYRADIEPKLMFMHPPQRVVAGDPDPEAGRPEGSTHFIFVGASFFRKGGMEMLEALAEARSENGYDLKLTIVSSLGMDSYATGESPEDRDRARKIISANDDWIEFHESLPNAQVLELMQSAHVGILPTHADTYGYSVLELQACGCPVISTDVRALPEINNDDVGWLIEVPKNRLGEALFTTADERRELSRTIKAGLVRAVGEVMDDGDAVRRKSRAARLRIETEHSPEAYADRLGEIYRGALDEGSAPVSG